MSVSKAVVLCLALLLAAEAVTGANVTKFDTPKGPLRPDNDTDASKSSEERVSKLDIKDMALFKRAASEAAISKRQKWKKISTSAAVMFNNWKLHKDPRNLLDNPKFLGWILYAEKESPQDKGKWADIVMERILPRDLYRAINNGIESPKKHTRTLAKHLQLARYEILTKNNNFSPIDTFKEIKVDDYDLLAHPAFQQWYNYCKHQLNYEDSAIAFAMWKNSDTEDLLSALDRGKEVKSTKELATKLYAGLLKHFDEPSSEPIKIIFPNYDLDSISGELTSLRYTLWKDVAFKDADISEDKMFIDALRKEYSDSAIAYFIVKSDGSSHLADIIPTLKNRIMTELAHSNEAEFEEINGRLNGYFPNFMDLVKQERSKYLKSLLLKKDHNGIV